MSIMGQWNSKISASEASNTDEFELQNQLEIVKIFQDQIFSNPLITDNIFKHLETPEILASCCLVSKKWNVTARKYLHHHRKCLLKCDLEGNNQLKHGLQIVQNGIIQNLYPLFNGLSFTIKNDETCELFPLPMRAVGLSYGNSDDPIESLIEDLIHAINLKHVEIIIVRYPTNGNSWITEFLMPLLASKAQNLENLRITTNFAACKSPWDTWFKNIDSNGFANLKSIKAHDLSSFTCSEVPLENYEALLFTCPSLVGLQMPVTSEALMIFDKYNKLNLVKDLVLSPFEKLKFHCNNILTFGKINDCLGILDMGCVSLWTVEQFQLIGWILQLHLNSLRKFQLRFVPRLDDSSIYDGIFELKLPTMPLMKEVKLKFGGHRLESRDNKLDLSKHPSLLEIFPKARILPECEHQLLYIPSPNYLEMFAKK